jgi:hypothetical protein
MKAGFKTIVSIILFITTCSAIAETPPEGPYFGLTPPGATPQVFAPGRISLPNRFEQDICFSQDGGECYFTIRNASWSDYRIYWTRYTSGAWTTPAQTSFSDQWSMCASLADNDQNMYFNRDADTWKAKRSGSGWASPVKMGTPLNSSQDEWSCQISGLGNAFICSWRPGGTGQCDLWKVQYINGSFTTATPLNSINTTYSDCQPVAGPNEEYIIYNGNRPGGYGGMDLWISYANGQGGWTAPQNLGPTINTANNDVSASISPDYKYLFFSRQESSTDANLYWVDIRAVVPTMPDLNLDGTVDIYDLDMFCDRWLIYRPSLDVAPEGAPDGIINFQDFAVFAQHWQEVSE